MEVAIGLAFLIVSLAFVALALLSILRIGFGRLESRIGIERDGLPRGHHALEWQLSDLQGRPQGSPSRSRWQLLLFADHSLASFPALIKAINYMHVFLQDFEVIILTRQQSMLNEEVRRSLQIEVPIVPVSQTFYHDFNVRVMPFGILLDPAGVVWWTGLANYEQPLMQELLLARRAWSSAQAEKGVAA